MDNFYSFKLWDGTSKIRIHTPIKPIVYKNDKVEVSGELVILDYKTVVYADEIKVIQPVFDAKALKKKLKLMKKTLHWFYRIYFPDMKFRTFRAYIYRERTPSKLFLRGVKDFMEE